MGNVIIKLPSGGGGGADLSDATAVPSDVTKGKIFYGSDGRAIGTHALTDDLQDGNAVPSDVFKGKTFYNKNGRQVGTFSFNGNATPADVASGKTFYNSDGYAIGKNPIVVNSDTSPSNMRCRADIIQNGGTYLVIKETSKNVFEISTYAGGIYVIMSYEGASTWFAGYAFRVNSHLARIIALDINGTIYGVPYPITGTKITVNSISSFTYSHYLLLPYGSEVGWAISATSSEIHAVKNGSYTTSTASFYLSQGYNVTAYGYYLPK